MAKEKQSKTDAIRKALKQNSSPSEVAALLKKQGIKVTPQYVSVIKASDKRKAESGLPPRKRGRPTGSGKTNSVNASVTSATDALLLASDLISTAGSPAAAKQFIDEAARLRAKILR